MRRGYGILGDDLCPTCPRRGEQVVVPQRHVRTGHEHHQSEPHVGQEREDRVTRVQYTRDRRTEQDPGNQLTQDDRKMPPPW